MGRGINSGGGQSSLGYLFGSGEAPKPTKENAPTAPSESNVGSKESSRKMNAPPQPVEIKIRFLQAFIVARQRTSLEEMGKTRAISLQTDHQQRSMRLLEEILLWVIYLVAVRIEAPATPGIR